MENYPYIPFVPNRKIVMRRLGSQKANFPVGLDNEINNYLKKAQSVFSVKGKAKIYNIQHITEDKISLEGYEIESFLLSKLLGQSDRIYLMCTTIPGKGVDKIGEAMRNDKGLLALVFDAYASECVDGAFDVLVDRKNTMLKRTGQRLTKRRFSAGYGDLDIKYQKIFFDILGMQTLGVNINDKYLLTPEKSVIAIAGVE